MKRTLPRVGIDYLYLEALRGTSCADVRRAIVDEMSAEGWRATAEDSGAIQIEIAQRGEWTVVLDVRDKLPTEWAERLAHSLGVVGISARSWSDYGSLTLARFDGDQPNGRLSLEERPRAGRVTAAFLADLAPAKNWAKLRDGVVATKHRFDDVLEKILALTGLPAPFTRYTYETGGKMLRFRRPVRPVPNDAKPSIRVHKVRFETSFHVRDVAASVLVEAIGRALVEMGLRPVDASEKPARQVFVRDWHGWTSFGEVVRERNPVDWGTVLSRALAKPVLSVFAGDASAELQAFVGGRLAARGEVFQTNEEFVVDKALLAPFGVKKKVCGKLPFNPFLGTGEHRAAVESVGAALGLDMPILSGSLKGRVLAFGDASTP